MRRIYLEVIPEIPPQTDEKLGKVVKASINLILVAPIKKDLDTEVLTVVLNVDSLKLIQVC